MVYNNEHKDTHSSFNRHFPGEPRLLEEGMTAIKYTTTTTTTTTTVLRSFYRLTCISQHLQLRNGGFLLAQSFTAHMPLLTCIWIREKTMEFSSYLHCLHTVPITTSTKYLLTNTMFNKTANMQQTMLTSSMTGHHCSNNAESTVWL